MFIEVWTLGEVPPVDTHLAVFSLSVMEAVIVDNPKTLQRKKRSRSRDHSKKYYHLGCKWKTEKHTMKI